MDLVWWIVNVVGLLVVIPVVVYLGSKVIRIALEIRRYGLDIADRSQAVASNLHGLDELTRSTTLAAGLAEAVAGHSEPSQ